MVIGDRDQQPAKQEGAAAKTSEKQPADAVTKEATTPQPPGLATAPSPPVWQGFPAAPAAPSATGVAKPQEAPPGHRIGQILEPALWMVGALLIAAAVVMLVQAWRKRTLATRDSLQEQLAQFRDAFQKGQMSKEEYHRVHSLLTTRIRDKLKTTETTPAKGEQRPPDAPLDDAGTAQSAGRRADAESQEKPAQDNGQV